MRTNAIIYLWKSGYVMSDIAKIFHMTTSAIYHIVDKYEKNSGLEK